MAGARLGTETADTFPAINNSPPQTASGGLWLRLGWDTLVSVGKKRTSPWPHGLHVSINCHLPPGAPHP